MPWTWSTQQGQDPGHRVSFNICRVRFFKTRKNMSLSLHLPEWASCDMKKTLLLLNRIFLSCQFPEPKSYYPKNEITQYLKIDFINVH